MIDEKGKIEEVIDGYPVADLEKDTLFLCREEPITLGQLNEGLSFMWSNGSSMQTIQVTESGYYAVTVSNECGISFDEIVVLEQNQQLTCIIESPNVFAPDGDGVNDGFRPFSDCCFLDYNLQIFSRWGGLVFESSDPNKKWDGTKDGLQLPSDVYIWNLHFLDANNQPFTKRGELTLIR